MSRTCSRHYVDRLVDEEAMTFRRFSVAAQNRLRNYPWPGNVRGAAEPRPARADHRRPEEIGLDEIEQHLVAQQTPDEPLVKQDLLALPLREAREQFERPTSCSSSMLCNGKVGPAREACRHGAHASVPQAALAGRRLPANQRRLIVQLTETTAMFTRKCW